MTALGAWLLQAVRDGLLLALVVSAVPVVAAAVAAALAGVLQAAAQIQDAAVSFVPKLVAVALVVALLGTALAGPVVRFARAAFVAFPLVR